ncbi:MULTISPECIES: DUF805 domain-containing protein [Ramlibacter]|uniref:DUF805 domain-containing protein n=1 Tax=Ramlibacter aquaticus TaxID=2780094 RepID=A0ABR9SIR0_9BURK|nr:MULTISPECIES: DUF805 domain-containing protein [Ramlibacter]MBE7942155.1 DUF805 domain-containing protein [Ramlibacter aquaticus]
MDFFTSVKTCLLDKYTSFEGRASRPEFWWFMLFCVLVQAVGQGIFRHWLMSILSLALLVPSFAVGARRLHDTGRSGWFQLVGLIPLIGWAIEIYWMALPGSPDANAWGAPVADVQPVQAPGQY